MKVRTPKPNQNTAEPPAVIANPPPADMVETPPGPETDIAVTAANENAEDKPIVSYDTTSEDLMASATGRYEDIPPETDAEIAAAAILEQTKQEPVGLTDTEGGDTAESEVLVARQVPEEHPEQKWANMTFDWISGGSQRLLDAVKLNFDNFAAACHRSQLLLVAKANDFTDWIKKTGNELWVEYDKLAKQFAENAKKRKAAELAAVAEYLGKKFEERLTEIAAAFENDGNYTKEMRRMSNRLQHFEEKFLDGTKKTNNAITTTANRIKLTETVSPKILAEYTKAMLAGRHAKAAGLYRTMTGTDLEVATSAIEAMVAA